MRHHHRFIPRLLARGLLLLALLLPALSATAQDRRVDLAYSFSVTNPSDEPMTYYHRVSIPAADHPQQTLLGIDYPYPEGWRKKQHKNDADHYAQVVLEVPPNSSLERTITYRLRLHEYVVDAGDEDRSAGSGKPGKRYLEPSDLVESDAAAIEAVALGLEGRSTWERLLKAHAYPGRLLDYRDMSRSQGALFALQERYGDCTEYATLFVALARAMDIPARYTTEFTVNHDEPRSHRRPNHHAAEVWVDGRWIPADPNLAIDDSWGYGLGFGDTRKIVLKREGAWTWSDWYPGAKKRPKVERQWRVVPLDGVE